MTLMERISNLATTIASAIKLRTGFSLFVGGKPIASEVVFVAIAPYAFNSAALSCVAVAGIAATAQTVFSITKNGAAIGTVTFAAGSTTGTFNFTNNVIAAGNIIRVIAPSSVDATLADIAILVR